MLPSIRRGILLPPSGYGRPRELLGEHTMNDREKLAAVAAIGVARPTDMNNHLNLMLETYSISDNSSLDVDDVSDFSEDELDNIYAELRSGIDTVENDA